MANPQTAYGEGSGTEGSMTLGYEADAGQDNFVYTRVRNRGAVAAGPTRHGVLVGGRDAHHPGHVDAGGLGHAAIVPTGDVLTVADEIVWPGPRSPQPAITASSPWSAPPTIRHLR